jgi:DNA excision repair protein ERCC-1
LVLCDPNIFATTSNIFVSATPATKFLCLRLTRRIHIPPDMEDDDLGADAATEAALLTADRNVASLRHNPPPTRPNTTLPAAAGPSHASRVEQPKPQALPSRSGPNSILVSPRQKGNPILNGIRSVPWEYSDILPDYVLGVTTCALFLSLKYHRLHPEYIYNRIQKLAGKYNLRILLTMVDIQNHEDAIKELSKTSLINNVTIVLCWSAQEAGRYLELYKVYEHAAPTSIRAQQSTSYPDKMVEFITVPRSVNKTDAVGLVSNFGSIRTAINARPEDIALIAGWGEKKVQRWCSAVREPFRVRKAAKRGANNDNVRQPPSVSAVRLESTQDPAVAARLGIGAPQVQSASVVEGPGATGSKTGGLSVAPRDAPAWRPDEDEEAALREATNQNAVQGPVAAKNAVATASKRKKPDEEISEGVMAALAKLRKQGS